MCSLCYDPSYSALKITEYCQLPGYGSSNDILLLLLNLCSSPSAKKLKFTTYVLLLLTMTYHASLYVNDVLFNDLNTLTEMKEDS